MFEEFFERILTYWEHNLYMHPIVEGVALFSLCKIELDMKNSKQKDLIRLYLISVVVLLLGSNILYAINQFSPRIVNLTIEFANNAFNLIEAYVFLKLLVFISGSSRHLTQLKMLLYLNILLTIIGFTVLLNSHSRLDTFRWGGVSSLIHFYSIIIPCIWYFYDIYKHNNAIDTKHVSLVLAITSYSLISIPIFAIIEYAYVANITSELFVFHFGFLSVVCLAFSFTQFLDTSRNNASEYQKKTSDKKKLKELEIFKELRGKFGYV